MGSKAKSVSQANFVFKGSVQKLKATTMPGLPVKGKTAVVRVDEVLSAPPLLSHYAGSDITVILGGGESVRKGEQAVFHTNSYLVGESLVVQSAGHTAAGVAASFAKAPGADADITRLREKVDNADAVVTGKVTAVNVLGGLASGARTRGGAAPEETTISEHNPVWQEAVIQVTDVEKGSPKTRQVVVRFPGSTDVHWYGAPKLSPGQEGVFLLTKGARADASAFVSGETTTAGRKAAANTFTVADADAFQPMQNVETIRALIKSKSSKR